VHRLRNGRTLKESKNTSEVSVVISPNKTPLEGEEMSEIVSEDTPVGVAQEEVLAPILKRKRIAAFGREFEPIDLPVTGEKIKLFANYVAYCSVNNWGVSVDGCFTDTAKDSIAIRLLSESFFESITDPKEVADALMKVYVSEASGDSWVQLLQKLHLKCDEPGNITTATDAWVADIQRICSNKSIDMKLDNPNTVKVFWEQFLIKLDSSPRYGKSVYTWLQSKKSLGLTSINKLLMEVQRWRHDVVNAMNTIQGCGLTVANKSYSSKPALDGRGSGNVTTTLAVKKPRMTPSNQTKSMCTGCGR
jgi:hypothetical protein